MHGKLEIITKKWWFYVLFILLQCIPPYVSKGYKWTETSRVIRHILGNAIIYQTTWFYPILKVIPIILILSIIILRNKLARLFNIYVAVSYVLFAVGQNISVTKRYGIGIIVVNLIMFSIVALSWFYEIAAQKNDFTPSRQPIWRYWVVPLAVLAFWGPINMETGMPDFDPTYLLTNSTGTAFCMMTPVYLALLTLYYPNVNLATLRTTSVVGVIIGLYNTYTNFFFSPGIRWFNGVLHLPLILIAIYSLVLSLGSPKHIHIEKNLILASKQ